MGLLTVKQLEFRTDTRSILTGIDCALHAGEFVGLIGANGTGKTTCSGGAQNQNRRYHFWHYRSGRHRRTCCFYEIAENRQKTAPFRGGLFFALSFMCYL